MSGRSWLARGTTLADQVLSGVSNLLVVVLVARALDAASFGRFALAYAVLTLTLGVTRGYFGTRITLAVDSDAALRLTGGLVVALAMISPLIAAVVLGVTVAATGTASLGILVLVAVITPVVCIQDILRYGAVTAGRPGVALLSDAVWVLAMALPVLLQVHLSSAHALQLWGAAAVIALVVALVLLGERPHADVALTQLRRRDRVGGSVALGWILVSAATLGVLFVVTRVLGPAAAGSLRGASTAMGPVNVLLAFTGLSLTATLARRQRGRDLPFCALTAVVLSGMTLLWGVVLLLLPEQAGAAAFGASWPGIRHVLPWTVVEYVALAVGAASALGLRARARAGPLLTQRLVAAIATVFGASVAALVVGQTRAVAAALAGAAVLATAVGWVQLSSPDEKKAS